MQIESLSTDQQLLTRLQAPPDLRDGIESLDYWRARRRQLPWYRVGARREAARMTVRWEQRVRAALLQRGAPIATRLSAGLLLGRTRLRRWTTRVAIAVTVTVAFGLLTAPVIAAVVLVLHAL
jgi:hypothetical protein